MQGITPAQLTELASTVTSRFAADSRLVKNEVGNLAVLDASGDYIGWVDLGAAAEVVALND